MAKTPADHAHEIADAITNYINTNTEVFRTDRTQALEAAKTKLVERLEAALKK